MHKYIKFLQTIFYYIYRRYSATAIRLEFRFTGAGKFIFACIIISGAVGIDTRATMAFVVFSLLASIFIISLLYTIRFKIKLNVRRVIGQYAVAKTDFRYKIFIESLSDKKQIGLEFIDMPNDPRPTLKEFLTIREPAESKRNLYDRVLAFYRWVWLIDKKNHGIKPKVIEIPALIPAKITEIEVKITPKSRGIFSFKEIIICRGDPVGLFRAFQILPLLDTLIILPSLHPVSEILVSGVRKYNQAPFPVIMTSASSQGDSTEFYAIRDYLYGDPVRHIDWKGWAKTGKPVIKEYHEEYFSRYGLVLDTFGDGTYDEVFEGAVEVAASYLFSLKNQESLIDLIFVEDDIVTITVGRGLAHKENAMELLALVKLSEVSFDILSHCLREKLGTLSSLICVFIKWDSERKELVDFIRASNVPVKILLIRDTIKDESAVDGADITIIDINNIRAGLMNVI